MAPAKLKRPLTANRSRMTRKSADYFKRPLESRNKQSKAFVSKVTVSEKGIGDPSFPGLTLKTVLN
jgi:hypothetical protein